MISVRLPKELEERLNKLAIEEERPKSYIIRKALEEYLADYEDSHNVMSFLKDNQKIYPKSKEIQQEFKHRDLDSILSSIRDMKPMLEKKYHVKTIGVFGSYVRNEQTKNSDLDVLIELSSPIGLFAFMKMERELSEYLKIPVDLVMKSTLKPRIGKSILQEVIML
jgi:predicted nucleotidyltransferase